MDDKRKKELFKNLDWTETISVQNEAVNIFIKEGDTQLFGELLTKAYVCKCLEKSKLDNIVLILSKIGYPANRQSIEGLLYLLQDINWPGAHMGISVLLAMDRPYLLFHLEQGNSKWTLAIRAVMY